MPRVPMSANGGGHPSPRIQLDFNDAIKSLVAAGYGASLLPHELDVLWNMRLGKTPCEARSELCGQYFCNR